MFPSTLLNLVMTIVFLSVGVASYELTMLPDEVTITEGVILVNVTCKTEVALTGCQFSWLDRDGNLGSVLDLTGSVDFIPYFRGRWLSGYKYNGQGLEAGDCGVSLEVKGYLKWMIGCRVHTAEGGWRYAWMDLTGRGDTQLPTDVEDHGEVVVRPHEELRLVVKSPEPLGRCTFYPPGVASGLYFDEGVESRDSMGRYRYVGAGLYGGDCGLKLVNVSEVDNGPLTCYVEDDAKTSYTWRFFAVVVANRPSDPVLTVVYEGLRITSTCKVVDSRPEPTFTWLMGDKELRQDAYDDSPANIDDEWNWPWMKRTIVQSLILELTPDDEGKVLRCVVSHLGYEHPLEVSTIIPSLDFDDKTTTENTSAIVHTATNNSAAINTVYIENVNNSIADESRINDTLTVNSVKSYIDKRISSIVAALLMNGVRSPVNGDQVNAKEAELSLSVAQSQALNEETRAQEEMTSLEARKRVENARIAAAELSVEAMRFHAKAEQARTMAEEARAREAMTSTESRKRAENARTVEAELAVEAMRSHVKAEEARAMTEQAQAMNAKEELQFERENRNEMRKHVGNQESPTLDENNA